MSNLVNILKSKLIDYTQPVGLVKKTSSFKTQPDNYVFGKKFSTDKEGVGKCKNYYY
jgi:hypothetical protein